MDTVEEIRKFVEDECRKPENVQGYGPFEYHFVPMVGYASALAEMHGGDREVIVIAAWLHDIGSIMHGRENHHITGAEVAEQKLTELSYPRKKIALVKKCILNHRGSQRRSRESIEEKVIADADTLACFDDIAGIFQAAYCWEGHSTRESACSAVREKLERKWSQLHFESSRRTIKPKYDAAMLLLGR